MWLAGYEAGTFGPAELPTISMRLAQTPIGPMNYKSPAQMLKKVVENWAD